MTSIAPNSQSVLLREISNNRMEMNNLQRQLATGKVAETYGGLGSGRTMSLALREEMSGIESYQNTISITKARVDIMSTAIGHMRTLASDTRSQMLVAGYEPHASGTTLAQDQAESRLYAAIDMLNTEVAGRQLFSGTKTDEAPVRSVSDILGGSGEKAGFSQILNERNQADLGADERGRLVLSKPDANSVSVAEDFAGSPFGFKLALVNSNLSGTNITGPAGAPSEVQVEFTAALPNDGETFRLTFDLPDGTQKELELTAQMGVASQEGAFSIGVDAAQTSLNFEAVLTNLIESEANTSLAAASMQAAANDFFTSGTDVPQRIDGPPFDSAVALRDATDADTVRWYKGEISDNVARETSLAKVDDNQIVAYGAKADEEAFTTLLKQLAVMSSARFDGDTQSDQAKYLAMTDRVGDNLSFNLSSQSLDRVVGELAVAQGSLQSAEDRHITKDSMVTEFLAEIESADINEVGAKLLSMQTQLQASYQVTSMLSKLSLVNYL